MYSRLRAQCERWLRIPPDPQPPPGDESTAQVFLAAPNFYRYLLVLWGLQTIASILPLLFLIIVPIAVFIGLWSEREYWGIILLPVPVAAFAFWLLFTLFRVAVVRLDFEKRWYVVTDRSLRIREGVLTIKEMTVTFANIQNISVSQGPLQRWLGIADLRVDTAGGGGGAENGHHRQNLHTAWFRGINNAEEIRSLIHERVRKLRDAGLGDTDDPSERDPGSGPVESQSASILEILKEAEAEARGLRLAAEKSGDSV